LIGKDINLLGFSRILYPTPTLFEGKLYNILAFLPFIKLFVIKSHSIFIVEISVILPIVIALLYPFNNSFLESNPNILFIVFGILKET